MFKVEAEIERIEKFLKSFIYENEFNGAVLGVSGGLDSAVVAGILSRILPKDRIRALILPERDSDPTTVQDAQAVCETFNLDCEVRSITPVLKKLGVYSLQPPGFLIPYSVKSSYAMKKWKEFGSEKAFEMDIEMRGNEEFLRGIAYYRAKHRVRMCVLYMEAEMRGYTVVGTTNRTEWLTGFYVKWGDDATDVEPLLHLYKTQVYELARHLGVPKRILEKPPSPDLIPGLTDELALGMSYEELDSILMRLESGEELKIDSKKLERVKRLLKLSRKRNLRMVSLLESEN